MRILATTVAVAAAGLFALPACGDDNENPSLSATTTATTATTEQDGMAMEDGHESFDFGEPAEEADADRTIDVTMFDDFRYEPASIDVAAGETVAFQITNSGRIVHEFVIGDEHLQEEHEDEMSEMDSGMMMQDEPNAVAVEAGATKTLAFHFTGAADLQYACHQPGHYDAGMVAPLTVS